MTITRTDRPTLLNLIDLQFDPAWHRPIHRHEDFHEMLVITAGQVEITTHSRTMIALAGNAVLYPQNTQHQEKSLSDKSVRMICLNWSEACQVEYSLIRSTRPIIVDRNGRLLTMLRWMLEIFPAYTQTDQDRLDSLLQVILHEYANCEQDKQDEMVLRVKQYVHDHVADSIRLYDLANIACMSKYHFARAFKSKTHWSPMEYVRQIRIEKARSLLLTTNLSLSAIADHAGFRDEFHLSRMFRQITGQTTTSVRGS